MLDVSLEIGISIDPLLTKMHILRSSQRLFIEIDMIKLILYHLYNLYLEIEEQLCTITNCFFMLFEIFSKLCSNNNFLFILKLSPGSCANIVEHQTTYTLVSILSNTNLKWIPSWLASPSLQYHMLAFGLNNKVLLLRKMTRWRVSLQLR